jgi:hypothetical protein
MAKRSRWTIIRSLTSAAVIACTQAHAMAEVSFTGDIKVSGSRVIIEHRHGIETIDLVSGKSLWKLSTGYDDMTGPILVQDGAVYVSDGQMDEQPSMRCIDDLDITSAQGKLMLNVLSAISEFERDLLGERIKSGVAHARCKGTKSGKAIGRVI